MRLFRRSCGIDVNPLYSVEGAVDMLLEGACAVGFTMSTDVGCDEPAISCVLSYLVFVARRVYAYRLFAIFCEKGQNRLRLLMFAMKCTYVLISLQLLYHGCFVYVMFVVFWGRCLFFFWCVVFVLVGCVLGGGLCVYGCGLCS